jgi:uncharacterized repeat protein (TIGR01451 family)
MPARILRVLVSGVVLVVVLLAHGSRVAGTATAAGPVDQQNLGPAAGHVTLYSALSYGQSFTAGRTGLLDQVALSLGRTGSPGPLTVQIRKMSGGIPVDPVLATATVADSAVPTSQGWVIVPFPSPATVQQGHQYAIVLASAGDGSSSYYSLYVSIANPYAGGTLIKALAPQFIWLSDPHFDLLFQTFVTGLSVTLSGFVFPNSSVPAGQPMTYIFEVTNTSQASLGPITFGAFLPVGTTPQASTIYDDESPGPPCLLSIYGQRAGCSIGTLLPGQRIIIAIDAVMNFVRLGANLCATAQVNAGPAGATVTRQIQVCARVGTPDLGNLQSTVSCDPPSVVFGQVTTCNLTITNASSAPMFIPGNTILGSLFIVGMPVGATFNMTPPAGCSSSPPVPGTFAGVDCRVPASGMTLPGISSQSWLIQVQVFGPAGLWSLMGQADRTTALLETTKLDNNSTVFSLTATMP